MRFRNRGRHTGPSSEGMKTMHNATEFSVTLTPELYEQLRDEARLLGLSRATAPSPPSSDLF
jgi:hypothetical protein